MEKVIKAVNEVLSSERKSMSDALKLQIGPPDYYFLGYLFNICAVYRYCVVYGLIKFLKAVDKLDTKYKGINPERFESVDRAQIAR